jgi:CBS domain-containing protein
MRGQHVGALVVVDGEGESSHPVGIVTDRDIVVEVMAPEVDASAFTVGDIMAGDLVTVRASDGVFETIRLMESKGVRRVVVVDAAGRLVGILSLDDLVELLAEELSSLAKAISREQRREQERRK